MNQKQKAMINHLEKYYGNNTVKIHEDNDPQKPVIFEGTIEELKKFWSK